MLADDREDRFARNPRWLPYRHRILCVALCQGAALHYVDRQTGVKDFDVYTFYAAHSVGPFPARWLLPADFGPSRFGRNPEDEPWLDGRRVDLIGRSLKVRPSADPVEAVRSYLTNARRGTPLCLAKKAVVLIDPEPLRGKVSWTPADHVRTTGGAAVHRGRGSKQARNFGYAD
jgi:hypothetical protein